MTSFRTEVLEYTATFSLPDAWGETYEVRRSGPETGWTDYYDNEAHDAMMSALAVDHLCTHPMGSWVRVTFGMRPTITQIVFTRQQIDDIVAKYPEKEEKPLEEDE